MTHFQMGQNPITIMGLKKQLGPRFGQKKKSSEMKFSTEIWSNTTHIHIKEKVKWQEKKVIKSYQLFSMLRFYNSSVFFGNFAIMKKVCQKNEIQCHILSLTTFNIGEHMSVWWCLRKLFFKMDTKYLNASLNKKVLMLWKWKVTYST